LLASPGFNAWRKANLDINQILYTPAGKPRVAISTHLGDTERMFFVALLIISLDGWLAAWDFQPANYHLHEIFGYLPLLGNPPSKLPMLTLLKQARFGVGWS
jgi:hypothetical protein